MKLLMMPVRSESKSVVQRIWATDGSLASSAEPTEQAPVRRQAEVVHCEHAFYRKHTEGMLRRYGVLRMESGRVPSLLGRPLFRGKVSSYRIHGFDDVVIFVHDVAGCMKTLPEEQQRLLYRVAVQEYTFVEAATMLRMSLRSAKRKYADALDALTAVFLERRLLERVFEPDAGCQGSAGSVRMLSRSEEVD